MISLSMTSIVKLLFLSVFLSHSKATYRKSYKGYKDYRIVPATKEQFEAIQKLASSTKIEVDFTEKASDRNPVVRLLVGPTDEKKFGTFLKERDMNVTIINDDIQKLIDKERSETRRHLRLKSHRDPATITLNQYHSVKEIYRWLDSLARYYPKIVKVVNIGKSVQKRKLLMIKIGISNKRRKKKGFWIDAGIHAREWIAPAAALYVINELVTNQKRHKSLLRKIDFYILPVMNPDGYEFTKKDRMWRKNRRPCPQNSHECCMGVDLNRNFPFKFGKVGVSSDPCQQIYNGPKALSEPESLSVATFLRKSKKKMKAMITLHSYAQEILYPYGHLQKAKPKNWKQLKKLGERMGRAMKSYIARKKGTKWYEASGLSDDWARSIGIKIAYTIELWPDSDSKGGFILSPKYIIPTGKELFAGLLVVANAL